VFSEDERVYRLRATRGVIASLDAHYYRLANQPDFREILDFHERLVLAPSARGLNDAVQEFTVMYANPEMELRKTGTGGQPKNVDLGAWQSYIA
jgi:hypothetical protein